MDFMISNTIIKHVGFCLFFYFFETIGHLNDFFLIEIITRQIPHGVMRL